MRAALEARSPRPSTVLLGFPDDAAVGDLARRLTAQGVCVRVCHDTSDLATCARERVPALIVTDFPVREDDGFALQRLLDATRDIPMMLRTPGATTLRRHILAAEIVAVVTLHQRRLTPAAPAPTIASP